MAKKARAAGRKPAAKTTGLSVAEAGRLGGLKGGRIGGNKVKAERGIEFYKQIGKKGGARVKSLIEAGRAAMARGRR